MILSDCRNGLRSSEDSQKPSLAGRRRRAFFLIIWFEISRFILEMYAIKLIAPKFVLARICEPACFDSSLFYTRVVPERKQKTKTSHFSKRKIFERPRIFVLNK